MAHLPPGALDASAPGSEQGNDVDPLDVQALGILMRQFVACAVADPPNEPRHVNVATYYLSGEFLESYDLAKKRMDSCGFARTVRLQGNPQFWKGKIIEAWEELIDKASPVAVFAVAPHPPSNKNSTRFAAYILATQHLVNGWAPALMTVHDEVEDDYTHTAKLAHAALTKRQAIWTAGLNRQCLPHHPVATCTIVFDRLTLGDASPVEIPAGASIVLSIAPVSSRFLTR